MKPKSQLFALLLSSLLLLSPFQVNSQEVLSAPELLQLKSMGNLQLNPVADEVLFSISTPRGPNETPGGSSTEYFRSELNPWNPQPLFQGEIKGRSPQFSPDGKHIAFLYAEKGSPTQVWVMDASGNKPKKLTMEEAGVSSFKWNPRPGSIAYLSRAAESAREKELNKRGYGFIFYEENL